jgi:hypothetical protein
MSLLTVANDACDIIGIERQVAIAAGTGGDARQLYRLAKLELSELARRTSWQALIKEETFVSVANSHQVDAIPSDFLFIVNETLFNRTQDREVFGPVSPREWQMMSAKTSGSLVEEVFRIRGNTLLIHPTPVAGEDYAFEYVTRQLATMADLVTEKVTYIIDSDVAKLDEELVKLGVVWRWKNIKGLDYAEDFRTYEMQVANSIARDGGKRTISMDGRRPPGVPVVGIPAGNWTP